MTWLLLQKQVQVFKHLLPQIVLIAMKSSLKKICFLFNKEVVREELKYIKLTVEICILLLQFFFEVHRSA